MAIPLRTMTIIFLTVGVIFSTMYSWVAYGMGAYDITLESQYKEFFEDIGATYDDSEYGGNAMMDEGLQNIEEIQEKTENVFGFSKFLSTIKRPLIGAKSAITTISLIASIIPIPQMWIGLMVVSLSLMVIWGVIYFLRGYRED